MEHAGEAIGVHEGPIRKAMTLGMGTRAAPLVPPAIQSVNSVIDYSFGSSFFGMLQAYWNAMRPSSFQVMHAIHVQSIPSRS